MNKSLLSTKKKVANLPTDHIPKEIFFCPEESLFYAQCLERMVLNSRENFTSIIEFGTGDGSPVIHGLLKSQFKGLINGYELNHQAYEVACSQIQNYELSHKYVVHNSCFFSSPPADCLIANPPYIPAMDNNIYLPALHGGKDGATITKRLLTMNCQSTMLMISAYSDRSRLSS
jgi:methylase of polypeptide subunit release factors